MIKKIIHREQGIKAFGVAFTQILQSVKTESQCIFPRLAECDVSLGS